MRIADWRRSSGEIPAAIHRFHAHRGYVHAGGARRTVIMPGRQTGQFAEVKAGLAEGTRVILHPGDTLVDGARVRERVPD